MRLVAEGDELGPSLQVGADRGAVEGEDLFEVGDGGAAVVEVGAEGLGLLGMARTDRELESVFLQLAGPSGDAETTLRSGARKKRKSSTKAETEPTSPGPNEAT